MPWFNFAEVLKWVAPTDFAYLNEEKRYFKLLFCVQCNAAIKQFIQGGEIVLSVYF